MADAPRRALVGKRSVGWRVLIVERASGDVSPPEAMMPLFFRVLPTWEAALAWAISALEEFYRPPEPPWSWLDG